MLTRPGSQDKSVISIALALLLEEGRCYGGLLWRLDLPFDLMRGAEDIMQPDFDMAGTQTGNELVDQPAPP